MCGAKSEPFRLKKPAFFLPFSFIFLQLLRACLPVRESYLRGFVSHLVMKAGQSSQFFKFYCVSTPVPLMYYSQALKITLRKSLWYFFHFQQGQHSVFWAWQQVFYRLHRRCCTLCCLQWGLCAVIPNTDSLKYA